jgi:SAM-dependent methyltransferase
VDPAFVALLRCPFCRTDAIAADARTLHCRHCDRRYLQAEGGYFDLLPGTDGADGRTEPRHASTTAQRLMESELVARLYERVWRPTFVRLIAGRGAATATDFAGEFFIHKSSLGMDERSGPWLDLSCGPGLFTRAMAAAAPGATVAGIDISAAMLDVAVRRVAGYTNVTLARADAHDLPFADGRFAGVNNAGALHIYDDPEAAFCEVYRVLQPAGAYVGSTFAKSKHAGSRLAARLSGIRRFDPTELRSWLSRVGFADYEAIRFGDAFIFKVRKP